MILDQLNMLDLYRESLPHSKEIVGFLESHDIYALSEGQYPIKDELAFIIIQNYTTRPETEKKWESHRKYIDVQVVLDGSEHIGYRPIDSLSLADDYNEENDYTIYPNDQLEASYLKLSKGDFAIFYPNDAHKPGIHLLNQCLVKKAVIKTAV